MREEYEYIYRKYYKQTYLFLFKMCRDTHLAEDLTQETFYQAYLSLHRFKGNSDIFTFLAAIAKHTYYRHVRKNKQGESYVSLSDAEEFFGDKERSDPEYIIEKAAVSSNIRAIIDKMPDKYRDVIIYRVYADMSFAQIAAAMNITENSAKVLFFRAKKKMLEELKNGDFM
ncbi:MAG: RNA polymerase sigma factor [Lachnospiraceae bacterium]|nr:RNA polymerase sigma factor [Lachnospiraceae bacterium]